MKPRCEAAAQAAAGERQLTKADLAAIEQRIHGAAKALRRENPDTWAAQSPAERVKAAAEYARNHYLEGIAKGHALAIRRAQMRVTRNALYDSIEPGKQLDAINVDTFMAHGNSNATPVESAIRGVRAWLRTRLTEADERFLNDPNNAEALAKEARGEDSGNADAKRVTRAWKRINDDLLNRMDRAGIPVTKRADWLPQPWDWTRIPDQQTFVGDMLRLLDLREFSEPDGTPMDAARIRHTLEEAWRTLKTNGANKRAERDGGAGFSANIGHLYNATRQLHFKSADAWLEAMRKYGQSDNVGGILRGHWGRVARDLAIAETYGPQADIDYRQQVERALANDLQSAATPKAARKAQGKAAATLAKWDVLRRGSAPVNATFAHTMAAIRAVLSSSKLGTLVSQQPSDAAMSLNYLKSVGMVTDRVAQNFGRDFFAGLTSKERKLWTRTAATWSDSMHDETERFGDLEVYNRISRFLNTTVYKRSGMRALDRGNASAVAGAYYGTLGEHLASGKGLDDLPADSLRFLKQHGIDADNWELLRKVARTHAAHDERVFLNPADIYNVPDEALRTIAERRVAGSNAELKGRIDQLNAQTTREEGWTAARAAKLDALRQRAQDVIARMESREAVRAGHDEGVAAARANLLRAHVQRAEVEADIHRYLDTRDQQARVSDAIDAVRDDDAVAPVVQRFAQKVGTGGERIGALRAEADARIKAAEKALAVKEQAAGARIDARQNTFDRQVAARAKDLADFAKDMHTKALRRQELANAYQKQVGRAVADETARLRDETLTKVLGAYEDIAHAAGRGYSTSSISERHRMGLNQFEAGTLPGEVARMFYLIRQVPFGMMFTHLIDVPRGMNGYGAKVHYIARYMLGQAIATAVYIQMKHLITGEDPENMASWEFAGKALAGAGIGPLMAALLFGSGGEHQDFFSRVAGPGGEAASTAYGIAQTLRDNAAKDTPTDWGKIGTRAASFARSNMLPFGNFWYDKALINHLVYQQLQENVSPGYNERIQQRTAKRGVTQWWRQGEALPERNPNVGAVIGQPAQ